jgi:glycine cleavage system H protein
VNRDPFGEGWLIKVRLNGDLGEGLLDEAGYKAVTEGQSH